MVDMYIAPERIFLIYVKVGDVKENEASLGYVKYKLTSAVFSEKEANEEIKKNPSNLIKKVIEFQKELVIPKTKFELHGGIKW